MFRRRLFVGATLCLQMLAGTCTAGAAEWRVAWPAEDTNAVLHNPDMGWVLYENYPLDDEANGSSTLVTLPQDNFDGVDAVALMFSWQDIETKQNQYDFSRVDKAYDYWRLRGKEIQLRMSAESLMFWERRTPPAGKGVPDYVLAKMAPHEKQVRTLEGNTYTVVDARNPFYQKRLAAFLNAVGKHFDKQRPIMLIDLRGFGVWGEWHSGFRYPGIAAKREALRDVINLWSKAFPDHKLALSASYDPDGPKELYAGPNNKFDSAFTTNYTSFLNYSAFDLALEKSNITWRRDGCGGAVHSNERKLNEYAFSSLHRAPMMGEFLGGYGALKQGGSNWVSWVLSDALSLHPNYLNLIGWQAADARSFIQERPDLFARGLREMGYRLMPVKVACKQNPAKAGSWLVQIDWVNRGAGRALRDYDLVFTEMTKGVAVPKPVAQFTLPTSQWLKGSVYQTRHEFKLNPLPEGDGRLLLSLRDPETGRWIELPLANEPKPGCYDVGLIRALDLSAGKRRMNAGERHSQ